MNDDCRRERFCVSAAFTLKAHIFCTYSAVDGSTCSPRPRRVGIFRIERRMGESMGCRYLDRHHVGLASQHGCARSSMVAPTPCHCQSGTSVENRKMMPEALDLFRSAERRMTLPMGARMAEPKNTAWADSGNCTLAATGDPRVGGQDYHGT